MGAMQDMMRDMIQDKMQDMMQYMMRDMMQHMMQYNEDVELIVLDMQMSVTWKSAR